jgi:glycosyltransferase involved in cell wall biosynthesis
MKKYTVLFVSPIIPLRGGIGLAMRAWTFLQALAEPYRVLLLVIPVVAQVNPEEGLRELRGLGVDVELLPNRTLEDARAAVAFTGDLVRSNQFRAIHVFRLYMLPFIREVLALPEAQRPRIVLDMDDYESKTHNRLAQHSRTLHQLDPLLVQRAKQFEKMEDKYLGQCQRVYLCSTADRDELSRRFQIDHFRAIPNAVCLPPPISAEKGEGEFVFLFVGTLGYFPNEDAVLFFCREILPLIRGAGAHPFRVVIAGVNPGPRVQALARDPAITIAGFVPELAVCYRRAHAAIVPIRVGGGMRIKVLEAFSYHCPVVSTSLGAEGIDAIPERHLLIADTADDFARQCQRLMQEPALGGSLAHNAFEMVAAQYSQERVQELVRQDYGLLLS